MREQSPEPVTLARPDLLAAPAQPLDVVRRPSEHARPNGVAEPVKVCPQRGFGGHRTLLLSRVARSGAASASVTGGTACSSGVNPSARDTIWVTSSIGRAAGFA